MRLTVRRTLLAACAPAIFHAPAPVCVHAQVETAEALSALPLREIGPAVAGGRITDIAVLR